MAADISVYSMLRPQRELEGPLDQFGKLMSVKSLMGQNALQDLQRGEIEEGVRGRREIRDYFASLQEGAQPDVGRLRALSPEYAQKYEKQQLDTRKSEADLLKTDRENFIALTEESTKKLPLVRDDMTLAQYRDEQIQRAGMFSTPQIREAAMRAAQSIPARFDPQWIERQMVERKELFTPKIERVDVGGTIVMKDMNPFTNPEIRTQPPIQKTMTPGEVASNTVAKGNLAVNQAQLSETQRNNQRPVFDNVRGVFVTRPDQAGASSTITPAGLPQSPQQIQGLREDTDKLRQEFEAKPTVKAYRDVLPILAAAQSAPDTRAGDIQLAYSVGKILDPASVVREGELKLTGDAATVMQKVEGQLRTFLQGKGRMTPATRLELTQMLDSAVQQRKASFDAEKQSYSGIVGRRGYKPEDVFIETPQPVAPRVPAAPARNPTSPTGWSAREIR